MMMMMGMANQQRIKTNGIWINIAEKGTGPLVLLLHGFPEFWFAWRHQITHLANHGYHVVAPDLRGYGDSDSPLSPSSYTIFHVVGDLIGLLDHFGEQQAFVVGSDWGAVAAWYLSLFRPERVKALVCLSVPFSPRKPDMNTTDSCKQLFGDGFYICQFQEPGRAERAIARYDYLTVMKKFLLINKTDMLIAPPGMEIIDYLETPSFCPSWITEEELQVYADKFQESGFTGPLNYYRAMDLNWELLAPWQGSKITVPVKLIVGDKDIGFDCGGTKEYIEGVIFKSLVPNNEVVILNGHHFIHQERAQEVSNEILSFLCKFSVAE
ncbi:Lipid-phosphate phosphatase [Actinidia chinensis var. chinensis]|uniref:soluble epoxide hydrolase n=1 Tax=Actinidia chinensis var. chinensis TaxID=1590841 RepID=A0A2R6S2L6_ACTCC|nr:Lipid-phosphate phosphatase [Actinidia chinensis var. chinensis]